MGLLFTLIVRRTLDDVVPMAVISAPDMGYGKSLLVQTHCRIASGKIALGAALPPTEEEWGKQIASWLSEGRDIILLDNIEVPIFSPTLELVLTEAEYSRRNMGKLTDAVVYNEAVWIAAGINVVLRKALARRQLPITMAGLADPLGRESARFTIPDLETWALAERPRLLAAAYTVYRNWVDRGKPAAVHGRELVSFKEWSHTIGGILGCVGVDAFLEGVNEHIASSDPLRAQWEEFFLALAQAYPEVPFKASDVYKDHLAFGGMYSDVAQALPDDLLAYLDQKGKFAQLLGRELNARRGRVVEGWRLDVSREDAHNGNRFILRKD